jgi:hypothetical protein
MSPKAQPVAPGQPAFLEGGRLHPIQTLGDLALIRCPRIAEALEPDGAADRTPSPGRRPGGPTVPGDTHSRKMVLTADYPFGAGFVHFEASSEAELAEMVAGIAMVDGGDDLRAEGV